MPWMQALAEDMLAFVDGVIAGGDDKRIGLADGFMILAVVVQR